MTVKLVPAFVSVDGCDFTVELLDWLTIVMGQTFALGNEPIEPFTPFITSPQVRLIPVFPNPKPAVPKLEREVSEHFRRVHSSGASTMNSAELLWAPDTEDTPLNP